jgi:hypothetical protein
MEKLQSTSTAAMLLLASCAATLGTGPFPVAIDSEPAGAVVTQGGHRLGVTPCTASVSNETSIVTLTLDGYAPREADLGTQSNAPLVVGGTLLFGPFEWIAASTGNAWSGIDMRPVLVELSQDPLPTWTRPRVGRHDRKAPPVR